MNRSSNPHLEKALISLLDEAQGQPISVETLLKTLAGRGYPALLVIIALPFCLPIQIPGLSTPFGLLLAFMGFRIAFGKKLRWPKSLLKKNIPYSTLQKVVEKLVYWNKRFKGFLRPRFSDFVQNPFWHRLHGVTIAFLGLILALPLPVPFTNMLTALPIIVMGLGLLEDDGLWVLIAYFLALLAVAYLAAIFWMGYTTLGFL